MDRPVLELSTNPAGKNIRMMWVVVFLALIISAISAYSVWSVYRQNSNPNQGVEVDTDLFQAVFMEGGQVYFGNLELGNRWMILKNIYYLQTSSGANIEAGQNLGTNFQLVKLGSEIHGPEDVMYIDPQNVIFWENIKNDSQVVQAIQRSKK